MATENGGNLGSALLGFQSAAPALQRDKINPHFRSKYLSLESLMEQVLPVLNENGLVLIQQPGYEIVHGGDAPDTLVATLTTTLLHTESGDKLESRMLLNAAKDDPQGQGSAITYARRQAAMSMLGLVADSDDDANRAQQRRQPARPAQRQRTVADKAHEAAEKAGRVLPDPAPTPTPEAADKPVGDAGTAPDDPARTAQMVALAESIIADIQRDFGDHPEGMTWKDRMADKCQEWFGHGIADLTTQEASLLVQRLRATKTKLMADNEPS